MGPAWGRFLARAAEPHEIKRRGEILHVYRLPAQRLIWNLGGVLIFVSTGTKLVESVNLSQVEHKPVLGALLFLVFLVPAAWFGWGVKFGVFVSSAGVKSVSGARVISLPWSEIARFVVDDSRPTTLVRAFDRGNGRGRCVWAEHPDGKKTPLDALELRPAWAAVLDRYSTALNGELERRRSPSQVAA